MSASPDAFAEVVGVETDGDDLADALSPTSESVVADSPEPYDDEESAVVTERAAPTGDPLPVGERCTPKQINTIVTQLKRKGITTRPENLDFERLSIRAASDMIDANTAADPNGYADALFGRAARTQ
jgi:hypothetical protein